MRSWEDLRAKLDLDDRRNQIRKTQRSNIFRERFSKL